MGFRTRAADLKTLLVGPMVPKCNGEHLFLNDTGYEPHGTRGQNVFKQSPWAYFQFGNG